MGFESGPGIRVVPLPLVVRPPDSFNKTLIGFAVVGRHREVVTMQNNLCLGERGDEGTHRRAIAAQGWAGMPHDPVHVEAIHGHKSPLEKSARHAQANESKISGRGELGACQFAHVKSEFGPYLTVWALVVGHDRSEFFG